MGVELFGCLGEMLLFFFPVKTADFLSKRPSISIISPPGILPGVPGSDLRSLKFKAAVIKGPSGWLGYIGDCLEDHPS